MLTCFSLITIFIVSGCSTVTSTTSEGPKTTSLSEIHCSRSNKEAYYEGVDGKTVLDLLAFYDDTLAYTGGKDNAFVTTICGYTAKTGNREFWSLYVDHKLSNKGAGSLVTRKGMKVEWKIESY